MKRKVFALTMMTLCSFNLGSCMLINHLGAEPLPAHQERQQLSKSAQNLTDSLAYQMLGQGPSLSQLFLD